MEPTMIGRVPRRVLVVLAVLAAAGIGVVVWQLQRSSPTNVAVPTVTAARGNIVVSVRATGKVVDARASARGAFTGGGGSATSAGGQTTSALTGMSQVIVPQAGGRVITVHVTPGQHVASGQPVARLDGANARDNLVSAQASLDQATAQLELDRSGVTPQSLASAKGAVAGAAATLAGSREALTNAARVNRDAVAGARQQVAQATEQLAADGGVLGPNPQSTAAGVEAVAAAREALAAAQAALADVRAVSGQQTAAAEHTVGAARQELDADQSRLQRDLATERRFCGANSPTITADTSSECVNAAANVASDQQAIVKDQGAVQSAQDALAQAEVNAAQSEHQAQAQVAAASGSLRSARKQLAALSKTNAQSVMKDRQALVAARSALTQARSKAAESASQARAQMLAASVGLSNAEAALIALEQGAPGPLIAQDQSKVVAARAQVRTARSALAQTVVRAPSSGTITSVFVAPGSPVDGSTPIAAFADLAHLAVSVDLSEFDAARVRRGMDAVVSVDALGGKRFPGRVVFEAVTGVDNGGIVTFPIRVALERSAGVRIGMNVSAQVVVASRRNVVTVPLEAISRNDTGRSTVTVVGATGGTSLRVVSLGLASNKDVEVTHGLRAGERVELQSSQGA